MGGLDLLIVAGRGACFVLRVACSVSRAMKASIQRTWLLAKWGGENRGWGNTRWLFRRAFFHLTGDGVTMPGMVLHSTPPRRRYERRRRAQPALYARSPRPRGRLM